MKRLLATLLAAASVAVALVAAPAAQAAPRPLVLVYGDSLVHEASPYARDLLDNVARVDQRVVGAPGGATCDLLPLMRRDAAGPPPAFVVIAFSGNAFTPCMQDSRGKPLQGDAWIAAYRRYTSDAIATFRKGSPTIWLGTPPINLVAEKKSETDVPRLIAMLRDLARQNGRVKVTESGDAVLENGLWTRTKQCLPKEPCQGGLDAQANGVNIVRAPDTAHFCPVPYPEMDECPTFTSGGLRYALGMLVRPLREARLFDEGRFARSIGGGWTR